MSAPLATSFLQSESFIYVLYIVAFALVIQGLRGLVGPKTAVGGNRIAAVGMGVAIVATLLMRGEGNWALIALGLVLGAAIGVPAARQVKMTAMPQMVALFNGVGGGAAALIALAELHKVLPPPGAPTTDISLGIVLSALIGAISMLLVELYRRTPAVSMAYNSALYALAGAAAGLSVAPLPERFQSGLLASLCFYVVDVTLLGAVLARIRSERYLRVVGSFFLSTLSPFVVMAAITGILVQLWRQSPWWSLLLAPPLIAIGIHQRSLLDTVRRQRELDILKDEFIAVISHELRTPLASVYGAAVTLEERQVDDETRWRLLGVIRRESARLATVATVMCFAPAPSNAAVDTGFTNRRRFIPSACALRARRCELPVPRASPAPAREASAARRNPRAAQDPGG